LFFLNLVFFTFQDASQLKPPRRLIKQSASHWQMSVDRSNYVNILNQFMANKL
jgi:hypothetical protein